MFLYDILYFSSYYIFIGKTEFCSPNVLGIQRITLTLKNEGTQHQSIKSPNYPDYHPENIDCVWQITAPPDKKIKFTFIHMALEWDSKCDYDYVELRNGLDSYSSKIGRYCGSTPPSARYSSGRYMWVKFHSNSNKNLKGFIGNFEAVDLKENGELFASRGWKDNVFLGHSWRQNDRFFDYFRSFFKYL